MVVHSDIHITTENNRYFVFLICEFCRGERRFYEPLSAAKVASAATAPPPCATLVGCRRASAPSRTTR